MSITTASGTTVAGTAAIAAVPAASTSPHRSALRQAAASPAIADVMKALASDVRWDIVKRMAATKELAYTTLSDTLPITKSTISYHIDALVHAQLITVRKEGRNYFYALRSEVLNELLANVASALRPPDGR